MKIRVILLTATAISLSSPVLAQQSADNTASASEADKKVIIVTARKREETLIEVPLAISAFSSEDIEQAGIEDVADVALQTPGFSFRQGFGRTGGGEGGASVRPAIRGMSNVLGAPNAGFFIDGVFISGNITSYQLDNLERVEVVKGPQAALYGRQTFAGAINFITRKPDNVMRGAISQTVGQYDHFETSGYISGPIVEDVLAGEVNARFYTFGGDYVNADSGKRDINDQQSWNIGGKLRFMPNANLEIIAQAAYGEDKDKGYATYKLGSDNLNCFGPALTGGTFFGIPLTSTRSRGYFCGEIEQPDSLAYNNDDLEALGFSGLDRQYFRTDLTVNYTTDSDWTITSITSFNGSENINGFDNDLVPSADPSLSIGGSKTKDFSQNLRVLSPQDASIRGLVGGYYFRQRDGAGFNVETDRTSPDLGTRYRLDSDDGVNNWALYGMLEFDVTDKLTLSAEARYQEDKILGSDENDGDTPELTPANGQRSETFKSFLPRFTGRYEITPDWFVYGSVAKGNKPGGFNDLPSDAIDSFNDDFRDRGFDVFDEEEVWSYEIGTKGQFAGSRIFFNADAFYIDWSQQQLTQSQPYGRTNGQFSTVPFVVNAGASEIKGFELELSGQLTDWFSFRAGYAYVNAEFTDFYDENTEELLDTDGIPSFLDPEFTMPNPADVDGPNGQVAGNKLPQTPTHQLNLSGTITTPVIDGLDFFLRNDLSYESNRFAQVHNLARTGDSYNWNIRAGVETDNLTLTVFVDNVLQDQTPLVATRLFDFNRGILVPDPVRTFIFLPNRRFTFFRDFILGAPRKRQFGMTLKYKF
jgi:outer membrane receptor protein involved in Fe transport